MIAFWRAVRWPLLVLAIAAVGIGLATVLDRTASSEWALTIGGPALTVLPRLRSSAISMSVTEPVCHARLCSARRPRGRGR